MALLHSLDKFPSAGTRKPAGGYSLSISLGQTEHLKETYDRGFEVSWKDDDFIGLIRSLENS